jgi:hypothetical protein
MRKRSLKVELPPITETWKEGHGWFPAGALSMDPARRAREDRLVSLCKTLRAIVSLEEVFAASSAWSLLERHESSLGGLTPVPQKTPKLLEPATVECELCGDQTNKTGTKRCDRCYELETRIQDNPQLAELILERVNIDRQIKESETRDRIKKRAYELDPECWISYSGKPRSFKRYMDQRRTEALRSAEKEVGRQ